MSRLVYRKTALFFLAALLCGQVTMLLHFAFVEHIICAKHGVATHRVTDSEGGSDRDRQGNRESRHCRFLSWMTSPKAEIGPDALIPAPHLVCASDVPAIQVGYIVDQRALFELSPSQSPPAPF
jgi:hypothetical protein